MCRVNSKQRLRRRRAVGVHVADQIPLRRELETLDERAALADGLLEFIRADHGKFRRDLLDDAERVVRAAVEHDDDLEFAGIIPPEELRVIAQHRFDARFFVVSRDQDEQARVGHADSVAEKGGAINLGKWVKKNGRNHRSPSGRQPETTRRRFLYTNACAMGKCPCEWPFAIARQ